jgi:hypothetical protein
LDEAARGLGVPAKVLRAIEWDRRDLLARTADVERIERRYAALLDSELDGPAAVDAPEAARSLGPAGQGVSVSRAGLALLLLIALVAPLLGITLVYVLQDVVAGAGDTERSDLRFGVTLGLFLLSSLLMAAAVLPLSFIERTPVPSARYARYRQPLALAAIGILVPVVLFTLLIRLT